MIQSSLIETVSAIMYLVLCSTLDFMRQMEVSHWKSVYNESACEAQGS